MIDETEGRGLAQRSQRQPTPKEVVELLKQGASEEDLMKYGIAPEVIEAALQMLMQEMSAPVDHAGMGLAAQAVKPI